MKTSSKEVEVQELRLLVQDLLDLCVANNIDVPEDVRRSLITGGQVGMESGAIRTGILEHDKKDLSFEREFQLLTELLQARLPDVHVLIQDGSYTITRMVEDTLLPDKGDEGPHHAKQKIKTVGTESPINRLIQAVRRCIRNKGGTHWKKETKTIMEKVNLALDPGKMYLVLGAPGSGKSTLLKMIANNLHRSNHHKQGGRVLINGVSPSPEVVWSNLVSYMDQIDRLHPYLTVYETCAFAWCCRSGGTHRRHWFGEGPEIDARIEKMDSEMHAVNAILKILGLSRVKDTFVGDQENVRGVSGGEKKRVTIAEMLCVGAPILCCDEISTGLDAATTYDITKTFGLAAKIRNTTIVVSLLQPPPETVANFDELILVSGGKVFYSGPVDDVIEHFNSLGYDIPERMDVADWLQALPTKDGWTFLKNAHDGELMEEKMGRHLSADDFVERFYSSQKGAMLLSRIGAETKGQGGFVTELASTRYANSPVQSLKLLVQRELLLWSRDRYEIKVKLIQSVAMGIIIGTLFWQQTSPTALFGVMFQSLMFTLIGAMGLVVRQFPERGIFYKHQDANFFPTWTFVIGRTVAAIPGACIDALLFGTIIYWFVGLAYGDGASIAHYFLFVFILFCGSLTTGLVFSVYSAIVATITIAQACMALTAVIMVLFSGFTVQPDVIPGYYIWIYWLNFIAWLFRGIAVNEFDSGSYDQISPGQDMTEGDSTLTLYGIVRNDEPYGFIWAIWGVLFSIGFAGLAILVQNILLSKIRFATGQSLVTDKGDDSAVDVTEQDPVNIAFTKATLTFRDIHYTVSASTSDGNIELLKGVDGVIQAGRMTALMGASGAGKTTLMDVLAMKKRTGEISGEIRLNGHLQEKRSFRRSAGYVEQFDVQTPELTVRETLWFSAKLRLDERNTIITKQNIETLIDQTMSMLELTNIQDLQIGSDDEGGLSFEQRKRVSIAVELVANPSIIFLDEPTSGLDARAAAIVMRGLKRIAMTGRAVCATIHQPSIAIFNDFDCLLLLKRGGEVVFFGDLGNNSECLIKYMESSDATPPIRAGENPATWMLTTIGAGSAQSAGPSFDYASKYFQSALRRKCLAQIDSIASGATDDGKISFPTKFATSTRTQQFEVLKRAVTVYFRSPNYNLVRIFMSVIVALVFSSVYVTQRVPQDESDMNSRINSIFIAVVFLNVSAINTVLGVFQTERNMFYRHKAALMYGPRSILMAFTLAEIPYLFMSSLAFMVVFYFIMGFAVVAEKFFYFWLFYLLGLSAFTYTGQMLMSLMRDAGTAQSISSLFTSVTLLFAGILLRPSDIPNFWIFGYWLCPGHYLFEGILTTQYHGDTTPIEATSGSLFYSFLGCDFEDSCTGTAGEWIEANFADFSRSHVPYCLGFLIGYILVTRIVAYWALTSLNYRST